MIRVTSTANQETAAAMSCQDDSFALFITWTCYGTWLPGDRRGYVSNVLEPDETYTQKRSTPGTAYAAEHPRMRRRAKAAQKHERVWLRRNEAGSAAEFLVATAAARRWRIWRGAIMGGHVHLLLLDVPDDGAAVRRVLKGCSQAALSKKHGTRRWWTSGGSDRYLHREDTIQAAARYVEEQEGTLAEIRDMVVFGRFAYVPGDRRDKPGGSQFTNR